METKLKKNNSNELIIFLSGWGCDNHSFEYMKSSKDVLICWDYSFLNFDFTLSNYKKIYLIAYSAGVFVAGLIKNKLPKFDYKVAINGNPYIFDEKFGIPQKNIKIFKSLNLENYMKFRLEYLVRDEEQLKFFNLHQPHRTFESCFTELDNLEKYASGEYEIMDFDCAIISSDDKIFIPEMQKKYYQGKYRLLENSAHDVFYNFRNFDDILDFAKM